VEKGSVKNDKIILSSHLSNTAKGSPTELDLFSWGLDVMITIFCDFDHFRRKIGVFLKNQCYDIFFALIKPLF
jgi:hypothetical protein